MPISIPSGKTDRPASKPETNRDERPVSVPVDHATFNDEAVRSTPRRVTSSTVTNMDEDELDRLLGIGDGGNEGSVLPPPETITRPVVTAPNDDIDDLSDMLPAAPVAPEMDEDDDISGFDTVFATSTDSAVDTDDEGEDAQPDFGSYSKSRGDVSTIEIDEDGDDDEQLDSAVDGSDDDELDSLLSLDRDAEPAEESAPEGEEDDYEDPLARFNRIIAETEGEDGDDDDAVDIFADGDEGEEDDYLDYGDDSDDDEQSNRELISPADPHATSDDDTDYSDDDSEDDDEDEYDLADGEEEEEEESAPVVFAPLTKKSRKAQADDAVDDEDKEEQKPEKTNADKPSRFGGLKGKFASIKEQVLADARGEDPAKATKKRPETDAEDDPEDDGKQRHTPRKKPSGSSAVKKAGGALFNNPLAKLIRTLLSPVTKLWMIIGSVLVKVIVFVVSILAKLPIIGKFIAPFLKATKALNLLKGLLPLVLILGLLFWTGQKDVPLSSSASLPDNGSVSFDAFGYDGESKTAYGTLHNTGEVIAEVKVSFTVDTVHPTLNPFTWFSFRPSGECSTKPVSLDIDGSKKVSVTCENVSGLFPRTSGVVR